MSALQQGSLILVTGTAGYVTPLSTGANVVRLIGAAVTQLLLKEGYKVRGATRSKAKVQPLQDKFDAEFGKGKFHFVEVADFAKAGAYEAALEGKINNELEN